jgi:hypothetical protein
MFRYFKGWNFRTIKQRPLHLENRARLQIENLETRTLLSVMGPNTFFLDIPVAQVGIVVAEPANLNEIQMPMQFKLSTLEGINGTTKLLPDSFTLVLPMEMVILNGFQMGNQFSMMRDSINLGNTGSNSTSTDLNTGPMQVDLKNGIVIRRITNQSNATGNSQLGFPDSGNQVIDLGNNRIVLMQSNSSGSSNSSNSSSGGQARLILNGSNSGTSSSGQSNNGTSSPDTIRESVTRTNQAGDNSTSSTTSPTFNFVLPTTAANVASTTTNTPATPAQRVLAQADNSTSPSAKFLETILTKETYKTASGEEVPVRGRVDDREAAEAKAGESVAAMGLFDDLSAEDSAATLQNRLDDYYMDDTALITDEADATVETNSVLASLGAILGGFWFTNFKKAEESNRKRKPPRFYEWWKKFRG